MADLRSVLKKHGFSFKKCFGQNFISDEKLLEKIVDESGINENDTVVEIGCGGGTLTAVLASRCKKVIGFEIDARLKPILLDMTCDYQNIEFLFCDFMKYNLSELENKAGNYTVVANLPYYITTPIIMRFLEEAEKVQKLVIMVQEEVALRLTAKENTSDYGAITPAIDARGNAEIVMRVGRNMFTPPPNVDSAVVKITVNKDKYPINDLKIFRETVKCAFLNRRKTFVNNLMQSFGFSREKAEGLMRDVGMDEKARGETFSTAKFVALSRLIENEKDRKTVDKNLK